MEDLVEGVEKVAAHDKEMYRSSMSVVAGGARGRTGRPCSNGNAIVDVLEEGGYELILELKLATTSSIVKGNGVSNILRLAKMSTQRRRRALEACHPP